MGIRVVLRKAIDLQIELCERIEMVLPDHLRLDGNFTFASVTIPHYVEAGAKIYDVGGGKRPAISACVRTALSLNIVGVDIDLAQLEAAPRGSYDETICADITSHQGRGDADLVIVQALLEHVRDTRAAFEAISSMLKPGGAALIFVPCRNALFARLNLLIPESPKRRLLYALYPKSRSRQGFVAFYDRCTPREFRELARVSGMSVEQEHMYFRSGYLFWCLPAYILWRIWVLLLRCVAGDAAAETFSMVLRKGRTA